MIIETSHILEYYTYFYKQIFSKNREVYKPTFTDQNILNIERFIGSLDKKFKLHSIGHNFLWNYFNFQFNYWMLRELKEGEYFGINKLLTKTAIERYCNRNKQWDSLAHNLPIFIKYNLKKSDLTEYHKNDNTIQERKLKEQYANTKDGYTNCMLYTSLYNRSHSVCRLCIFQKQCKEELLKKSKVLYDLNVKC